MKKVYIFYSKYYDFEEKQITIGGIQTYITNICNLCREFNLDINIVQMGKCDESAVVDGKNFYQYKADNLDSFEYAVTQKLLPNVDLNNDLFIFATDTIIFKKLIFKNSIAIQHGICWDIPAKKSRNLLRVLLSKGKRAYKIIRALKSVKSVVCVDYNFINWFRTQVDYPVNNFTVIPNFTEIAPQNQKPNDSVNIMFARRLFSYRGTRLFTNAIIRLLKEKENLFVTIAGSGPDEQWMRDKLADYDNVEFVKYQSNESLKIHADKHIAVVPTIGSEGTSLSLLEAMSSQCAVICTNVGGMTNIVLDGYNGIMITPDEEKLYIALKELIENEQLRTMIASKGYETVKSGFSLEKWQYKWRMLIEGTIE